MDTLERVSESAVVETRGSVQATSYSLTFSMPEIVEEQDGIWTVRDIETGIFGTGADGTEAAADLEQALEEHLDVLERQENLSPELEMQLRYLQRRVRKG